MEGNLDTAHISYLHQFDGIDDIPDDGSDKPGYPSNAMSWKFWRHDRAPRLELEETWYGFRYAGVRTTPNGNTHVRVTAYALPYSTMVASIPFSARPRTVRADRRRELLALYSSRRRSGRTRASSAAPTCSRVAPFSTPISACTDGIIPRRYTAENDYLIDRETQRSGIFSGVSDFVSQDLMVTESMGPIYDRTQEQLGSTDRAISRMRHILISAGQGPGRGQGAAGGRRPGSTTRSIRGAEKILEPGEDWRGLGTDEDPVVREALGVD